MKEMTTHQIEYTLSWEEYLELYSETWDKPNLVAVVTTAACAVIFGLVAFLLFQANAGQDNNVLWIFWALPGMLIAFTVWELRFRAGRSNNRKIEEIRSSFDRF